MKIISKILLTILICCGTYSYVSAQSNCAASCADIMAGAPADCGAVVNLASAGIPPGSTAQPEFGGDGSGVGCQSWVDVTDFSPIPGEPPAPGPTDVFTLCSSWTATLPDAAFPNFEGVVTAVGATGCFGGNSIAVFDAASCAPAGTLTQPGVGIAGQVTGLTIGTTYVVCTTYDYTNAIDATGAPCTPDPAQLTAEICSEVVEFGVPPLDPCTAVADPGLGFACSGSDFQVPLDIAGACTTDPTFDDQTIFPGGVSGYIAFYYSTDGGVTFQNCPAGSTADDVLADPNFIFFGESNAAGGGGCSPVDIGAFINPTCAPIDIPVCLLNGDVTNFFVAFDSDGDGVNDISCEVVETTVTIYPNIEAVVAADGGCDNVAASFVTDGMGGIIGDLDGDGLVTIADACDFEVLGGNLLDPAVDPADTSDDCADGSTMDYDFTPAYTADANYPGCVEPLSGTLTCVCDGPPAACTAAPDAGPAYACSGADFQVPLDIAGGCTTDPTWDDQAIFPGGVSGYIAFYYVDAAGNFTNCPAGSTADDVLATPGDPANGVPGFIFFGESNAANGGGCSPMEIGAFFNPTCDPVDIPICVLNGDVTGFFIAFDSDGDGVNDVSCDVYETTVTIYPNIEAIVAADGGCDNVAASFVTDGMGGIIGDLDGDGVVTIADACDFEVLGGNLLDPAVDPADTSDDCADGSTMDYDFTPAYTADANYPGCVEPLSGTLTCVCDGLPPTCTTSTGSALVDSELCEGANFGVTLNGCVAGDQDGYILAYDLDPSTVPTQSELYDGLIGGPTDPGDIFFFGEYSDCTDGAFDDLAGFTVPGCDPASLDIYIVPSNADFTVDPTCVTEGPLSLTFYPTLTATTTADGTANCGDVTVELQTILETDGSTVVCDSQTQSCANDGDVLTFDFSGAYADPLSCSTLSATSVACAGCDMMPDCEIMVDVQSSCDNLGNEDETDDITTFTVTVTGTGTGATFNASTAEDGGLTMGLMYGTAYTYTIVGTGGITVTFTDVDDSMCTETVIMGSSCTEPDIPTLSQWGLMILALLMMTFGALRIGSVSLSTVRKN